MKKIFILLFIILISVFSFSESKNFFGKFEIGENIIINDNDEGDLVVAGREIMIDRNLSKRVIVAGEDIIINSNSEELYLVGKKIEINGLIENDLNIVAKDLYINAPIGGNVRMVVGNATISKNVVIDGDIQVNGSLLVSEGATIKGNIYYKDKLPVIEGRVMGELIKTINRNYSYKRSFTFFSFKLFSVFYLFILTYIIFKLKKELGKERLRRYSENKGMILFNGFAGLVLIPTAAMLLFITILGFPIGVLLILLYFILIFLAIPVANLIISTKYFDNVNFIKILLSSFLIIILINLPFLGWIIRLFLVLLGLGSIIDNFKKKTF